MECASKSLTASSLIPVFPACLRQVEVDQLNMKTIFYFSFEGSLTCYVAELKIKTHKFSSVHARVRLLVFYTKGWVEDNLHF